jgi:hypothetical protein
VSILKSHKKESEKINKILIIAFITTLVIILLPMQITSAQICNSEKQNQIRTEKPLPRYGNSLVFFSGTSSILKYNATYPSLTLQSEDHTIKWFCLSKPWFVSAGPNFVVDIHMYHGIVRPAHFIEGETINFLFVFAKDVIVMLP